MSSSDIDQLVIDLTCPITLALFEDPITAPCCGKCISRLALAQFFESSHQRKCPLCNADLTDFNVFYAAKNTTVSSMVDTLNATVSSNGTLPANAISKAVPKKQIWSATLTNMYDRAKNILPISELKVSIENSNFTTKPSLFIAVVDQSGS